MDRVELTELTRAVQRAVGAKPDGEIGPETLKAVYAKLTGKTWDVPVVAVGASKLAAELVRLAGLEVGVTEQPRNSNGGPRVDQYQAADWLADDTNYAWCAAFICWLVLEASKTVPLTFDRPRTAGAWDFENWAAKQKGKGVTLHKPAGPVKVRAGDIVVFTFSHIGLAVADEEGGTVRTIEGNTNSAGSREGDGVYRKVRSKSEIRAIIRLS